MGVLSPGPVPAGGVVLAGVPWDEHSSFLRGCAAGPSALRAALASPSSNLSTESGLDLGSDPRVSDAGDLAWHGPDAVDTISGGVEALLHGGARVLAIGGDHAVTWPVFRAHARRLGPLSILHLDAHPDLYDEFEGDRLSHACPFARIMESGMAARLVQVGIRTMTPAQRRQAERFGVEVIPMRDWPGPGALRFEGPVYLSLDLDVLDPSCAPGVSHYEPGGATTREVLTLIQGLDAHLVGADVVELNPSRDTQGVTAMVAAKLVKEILARMLER
jgi:agmatinase